MLTSHCHRITPAPTQKEAGVNPQSQFGNKAEEKNLCAWWEINACYLVHNQSLQ
jgi:hypothetical protein